MLSNISNVELAELTRKMRVVASLPKESLTQKKKTLILITQTLTDQDEQTTSELVFKRKRKTTTPPPSILISMGELHTKRLSSFKK